jgi:predicted ATPase
MSKRLQVLFEESELDEVRREAERHHMTVAEWVRQALRAARRQEPEREAQEKLDAIRRAAEHDFPSGDIDQLLAEIERGFLEGPGA